MVHPVDFLNKTLRADLGSGFTTYVNIIAQLVTPGQKSGDSQRNRFIMEMEKDQALYDKTDVSYKRCIMTTPGGERHGSHLQE